MLFINKIKSEKIRNGVVERIMSSQSCSYPNLQNWWLFYLHGKRTLPDVIKLRILRWEMIRDDPCGSGDQEDETHRRKSEAEVRGFKVLH